MACCRPSISAVSPLHAVVGQRSVQPGPGLEPVTPHRAGRHIQHGGGLGFLHSAEEAALDHPGETRIQIREAVQRLVDGQDELDLRLDRERVYEVSPPLPLKS